MFSAHRPARAAVVALSLGGVLLTAACASSTDGGAATSSSTSSSSAGGSSTAAGAGSAAAGSTAAGSTAAGSGAGSGSAGATGTGAAVTVTISDAGGCVLSRDTVPAGSVTFHVVNTDAAGITEAELVSDQRIVAEQENLTPGFDASFTVRVDGGSYQFYCPGARTERVPFTVTGQAAQATGDVADSLKQATVDYAGYVSQQVGFLLAPVRELATQIKAGNLAGAQQAYAKARPFYERIEPVAESFPDLDSSIDLRIGDLQAGATWTGFHPIEQGLFAKKSTAGLSALAEKLVTDVQQLKTETDKLGAATKSGGKGYQPFEIANGSADLLGEVLKSKITGEEETYSKLDLLDFQANVEGSEQAFALLRPALNQIDGSVVPTVSAKFAGLSDALDAYRGAGDLGGWTPFDRLTAPDKKKLTDALLAVQEPLSQVSAKIAQ